MPEQRGGSLTEQAVSDRLLLERFIAQRDEHAFTGLVQRHCGTVWGVCKRILHHEQDAEDAFQAVFLALARNAASIRRTDAVGAWLYGVACRISLKARRSMERRAGYERRAESMATAAPPWSEAAWHEVQCILDAELQRLAEKYRVPFVLCCLEGMSKAEAAKELGWKEGTVSGRLAQARKLLQSRLARRGIALSAVLTAIALAQQAQAAAPAALVHGAVQTALTSDSAAVSPSVLALAEGVASTTTALKVKLMALALCLAALITGLGVAAHHHFGSEEVAKLDVDAEPVAFQPPMRAVPMPLDTRVFVAAFSPDGARLVTAGGMRDLPGRLAAWDVATGHEIAHAHLTSGVRTALFSSDGKTILTGDFAGNIKRRDATTGAESTSIRAHAMGVNCLVHSPNQQSLLSVGLDGTVKLWDANELKERKTFRGHADMVYGAAFFHRGDAFVTCGKDATAKIWQVGAAKEKFTLRGHRSAIEAVAVSPDDKTVATASWDGTIKLWNADTGTEIGTFPAGNGAVFAIAFSPDGNQLVSAGSDGAIRLWDADKWELIRILGRHDAPVWSLAFSRDGLVASGSFDATAKLWDIKAVKETATFKNAENVPIESAVNGPADKTPPKQAGQPEPPKKEGADKPAVVELLEDGTDFFVDHLDNHGGNDASVAARSDRAFTGAASLSVTPFQRFNTQLPGWNYKIAENPGPGEFRYLRFAWKRTEAPGIMLQIHARPRTWHRYYAGTLSPNVQSWGAMTRVADEPPRKWELVTRDLFKDFGPMTITGIGFSALEGDGEAYFDHMYLGRSIEDLDRVTASVKKAADPGAGADVPEEQPTRSRPWLVPAAIVAALLIAALALVLLVTVLRRKAKPRAGSSDAKQALAADANQQAIVCACKACGKKLKLKSNLAGKSVKCPQCGKAVAVPGANEIH